MDNFMTNTFGGIYTIKCPYDISTLKYPRNLKGKLEDIDLYIECKKGVQISNYNDKWLTVYVPSLRYGTNIVNKLKSTSVLIDAVHFWDEEVEFRIQSSDLLNNVNDIVSILKVNKKYLHRSPYSKANLPKVKTNEATC